jgi:RecG-like helicase
MTIADVQWRSRVRVTGRVRSVRVQPRAGVPTVECTLVDATGGISVVFLGRRKVAGIHPGTLLAVAGTAGCYHDRLAILNPDYEILAAEPGH